MSTFLEYNIHIMGINYTSNQLVMPQNKNNFIRKLRKITDNGLVTIIVLSMPNKANSDDINIT